ncbi:preprotein translocase subunit SecA [Burkholderia ambifaria]|uniref:Protein translocase subunit SecA n=1 Tax=Burkholderia ambifaria (strain ATCC BAA-244 / DSM 16087 / CCUG 44356 / LMG 19182 / AMMD) TaxID=339670 RepID=SECA_BURCM|nr:preprotein translocase subunit SecA [Burkholderia ambifaria]Q0BIJ2.1 RecName: Full=Protein translocase subunit SecA [Burkholderia ambifaria AMMD]ABI86031.1 protein translocase subunit secA [Burkholderia ambifaria AMMD]AJY21919.1 preprotein translocase, SecA subunit [Burkholderia ambifaria AMMD]ELK6207218.1 preprotein translocase subunit SecA [Burkholderia ambifaria]MBR7933627.1 preprotein translocase subunit SecA [Burkholderia ambifaria]MBR8345471.1 preprotein translocase subunit SecA [Bur
MTTGFLQKIFGSRNQRLVKQYQKTVETINALETQIEQLTDDQLRGKTDEFRQRVAAGESLDKLLPEAFAVCREASRRVLKMRHFDVQLIGGMVLHYGKIAEMRTGEGKTLVATLPVYLNALAGRGVHVVTVNDYLAQRDAEWMARLYNFLGLSVGINLSGMEHEQKQQAYASDITYGTNNEFGFDYLRDNMVYETEARVQRALNFAVVDEVDSILIDEARTPLIISGQAEDHTELYVRMNALPPLLERQIGEEKADGTGVEKPGDYTLDEKSRQVFLTESGHEKAERLLAEWGLIGEGESLYAPQNITLMHHVYAALRAHTLFYKDQHYVVQNGEVVIVDEFTGRLMAGRRWSDGLHQAVEAKEHVKIQSENQTLASITFQNYFRMYAKLAGMTGTADTEAYEFNEIYGLETVVIPTNRPPKRIDKQDQIYKTAKERYDAVIRDIRECYERGQPVLVGTTSIENSELLSHLLKQAGLPHEVLNAKQHEREAAIVAEAGRPKRITIATNMAGRGTDIVLGGNAEKQAAFIEADEAIPADEKARRIKQLHDEWETLHEQVKAAGGLHIIGTERHESRRIDNQLRGRAGRQGDPGSSRFYLSLDDPLLRIFAGDRVRSIMDRLKMPEGEAIEAGIVTRSIESAQRKVEARNFDIRKQLLEYDDVSNDQRKVIYQQRNELLEAHDITETISAMRHGVITEVVRQFVPEGSIEEQWDVPELEEALRNDWQLDLAIQEMVNESSSITADEILDAVTTAADEQYEAKVAMVGRESFSAFERSVMLQTVDRLWREHLAALDHLRQGIHLRGYAQKNPKQEYKREAFELFAAMLDAIKQEVTRIVMNVQIQSPEQLEEAAEQIEERTGHLENVEYQHADYAESGAPVANVAAATAATATADMVGSAMTHGHAGELPKVGRNDPCPCGSGKKYKQCHGKLS